MDDAELRTQLEQCHAASYGWALACCARAPELAGDVLQTAYLKILQGRARYRGGATFKTWLFAVIRVTAADEQRRQWLRHFRLSRYERAQEPGFQAAERGGRLDESARVSAFREALKRLPARQREIMHLTCYQELSLQEASEVMGVSLGSARKHYERAKDKLREWLEPLEHFDGYGTDRKKSQRTV